MKYLYHTKNRITINKFLKYIFKTATATFINGRNDRYGFIAYAKNPCIPASAALLPPYRAHFFELIVVA
jgi:hypothetical protein